MTTSAAQNPHVFISYAWGSEEHDAFVLQLAQDLTQNGVHVHLDKWDLGEGQDKYVFMERMVNDPRVSKVLMLCDRNYHDKANDRRGGVGVETQIISAELYAQVDQKKFIPLIVERGVDGSDFLPTFLKSRIYLDFSSVPSRDASFEGLLRAIYNKPLHQRPALGARPRFLDDEPTEPVAPWRSVASQTMTAFKTGKPHALMLYDETVQRIGDALLSHPFDATNSQDARDEQTLKAIARTLDARDVLADLFRVVITTIQDDSQLGEVLHQTLERLLNDSAPPPERNNRATFEDLRFFVHELLIYVVGLFLEKRRYGALQHVINAPYVIAHASPVRRRGGSYGVGVFQSDSAGAIDRWNRREQEQRGRGWQSPRGHWLKERATRTDVRWLRVCEADFFLYFTALLADERWYPVTGPYSVDDDGDTFETFVRAQSKPIFARLAPLWGGKTADEIRARVASLTHSYTPNWDSHALPVARLACIEQLASRA